jgi:hypothetical protein
MHAIGDREKEKSKEKEKEESSLLPQRNHFRSCDVI